MPHTPGPWHRDGFSLSTIIRCTVPRGHPDAKHTCGDYEVIARCEGDNWDANARLIEMAPELLETMRAIVIETGGKAIPSESLTAIRNRALAVITKIEGD